MQNRKKISTVLLLLPGAGFIFFFLSAAVIMSVLQSFGFFGIIKESGFSLEHWKNFFNRQVLDSLLFSLKVGFGSAFGTLLFSYPLALMMRKSFFGRKVLGSILKIPLFVPALVAAFLIVNTIAYHSLFNQILVKIGIIEEPLRLLRDKFGWGVLFIQVWKNLPFQFLIISSSVEAIRTDIEEAAKNLGANYLDLLRYVIIPLTMPGVLVAVILVFIGTFGDYAVTKTAGPIYPVSLSVRMHTSATMFQEWNQAACIGVLIVVVALAMAAVYSRIAAIIQRS